MAATLTAEEFAEGRYVGFANEGGACEVTGKDNAPTPGTDYYKFRRILGDHALRYLNENPISAMRLSDPTQSRIHTVNYELTDEERIKAGNNDYQIRGTIGLLWHTIETLRIMAHGTPASDIAWRQGRAAIEELLVPFLRAVRRRRPFIPHDQIAPPSGLAEVPDGGPAHQLGPRLQYDIPRAPRPDER